MITTKNKTEIIKDEITLSIAEASEFSVVIDEKQKLRKAA